MEKYDLESGQAEIFMWRRRFLAANDCENFRKGIKETFMSVTCKEMVEHGPEKALKTISDMWRGW